MMLRVKPPHLTDKELAAMVALLSGVHDRLRQPLAGPVVDLDSMRRRHPRRLTT
jgi:hypothetical protein